MVQERGGMAQDFAKLAGLTPPQLSKILNPRFTDSPPGVLTCLKLARASGFSAALVLRAAGHSEMAILIEQIAGRAERPPEMTGAERDLLSAVRRLQTNTRRSFTHLIYVAADNETPRSDEDDDGRSMKQAKGA
jgi:transcriptional regulator with XRE-family HTH domain